MKPEIQALREIYLQGQWADFKKTATIAKASELSPLIQTIESQFDHLSFMKQCWGRSRPMMVGLHTWLVCREITKAMNNFRNNISTFLITLLHFRSGKSEITTRFLPAHFISEFPDRNVIVTSHSTKKTAEFSRFGRALIRSNNFREIYPEIDISKENAGVEEWGIEGHEGIAQFFGILSGSAGTGGALIVTDDYFGGREDAESLLVRDKVWEAYTNNIFTRRDDPSINLITVTPWHPDDIVGRIEQAMKTESASTRYRIIRLPYKEPDDLTVQFIEEALAEETNDELKAEMESEFTRYKNGDYLFTKKYSAQWYLDMETSLGGPTGYGTLSLLRCQPKMKGGNRLKTENVKILKPEEFKEKTKGLTFIRAWDLASSVKQIAKSDPDYTCGVKLAMRFLPTTINKLKLAELYVADVVRGRWEAPKRNQVILDTALADGLIHVGIEAFGAYKDAYAEIKNVLRGVRVVRKMNLPGDKIAKAACLEPIFEMGNVYLLEGKWNNDYLQECSEFPDGKHDDQIDPTAIGYFMFSPVETGLVYEEAYVL